MYVYLFFQIADPCHSVQRILILVESIHEVFKVSTFSDRIIILFQKISNNPFQHIRVWRELQGPQGTLQLRIQFIRQGVHHHP